MKLKFAVICVSTAIAFSSLSFAEKSAVPYPDGYRHWTHVKSMMIEPGHALENPFQGIHHIYANDKAMRGLKDGKYPKGAVIVFDLLNYEKKDNAVEEAGRKLIGVMHKDDKKYSATGGWGFEGFAANSKTERLTSDGGAGCYSCHVSQKKSDYVYSQFRE